MLAPDPGPDPVTAVPGPLFTELPAFPGARTSAALELLLSARVWADGVEWVAPDAATVPAVQPTASEASEATSRPARSDRVGRAIVGRFMSELLAKRTWPFGRTSIRRRSHANGSEVPVRLPPNVPEPCSPGEVWGATVGAIISERKLAGPTESGWQIHPQGVVGGIDPFGSGRRWRIVPPGLMQMQHRRPADRNRLLEYEWLRTRAPPTRKTEQRQLPNRLLR